MRILLDECVHAGVVAAFEGYDVSTVTQSGWRGERDGLLLLKAESEFDVFVTIDRNLEHQQNLKRRNLGVIIVHVRSNQLQDFRPLYPAMRSAAERVRAGEVIHVKSLTG